MNIMIQRCASILCFVLLAGSAIHAQDSAHVTGPVEYAYKTVEGKALKAYVFQPSKAMAGCAAIVVFHGGGWTMGEPEWAFGRARHFAARGIVAIAAQYRLADQKSVSPLESMADARSVIQWMHSNASMLGIDPDRIVAYGWSAGGHLAASTAIFADTTTDGKMSSVPNALILVSPALYLEKDNWARRLLGERADISSISPVSHIRKGLPPTLILQGSDDTVTPLEGASLFSDRMHAEGNQCDLQIYSGVGHLFTPKNIRDDDFPQPDAKIQALAYQRADEFLVSLGLMR